jgi:general secretion pathway protein E
MTSLDLTTQPDLLPEPDRAERLAVYAQEHFLEIPEAARRLAAEKGMPFLEEFKVAEEAIGLLPARLLQSYHCLPLQLEVLEPRTLPLLTVWPADDVMTRWVKAATGLQPIWYLGVPGAILAELTARFGVGAESLDESSLLDTDEGIEGTENEDEDAAVIRFVNEVVQKAIVDRATDIHFEPHRETLQIRYRIDGQLVPVSVPENLVHFQSAIISRLKIMARLNISEKRRPQDGRIVFGAGSGELDVRISTFPTLYGESVSLRLLNQKSQPLSIEELGILTEDSLIVDQALGKPHGIVLVTGPTGSGKSTSLTAFIRKINRPERRIITVEDPVEYEVPGVNQTQIHSEIGLNFATALRHVLRQDPDVIMVGEIRDKETADIAIRASLTGHLVLSTIHTNDAAGALTRLIDMEIEPFLIASSVELIIAQRLVRRLCPNCAEHRPMPPGYLEASLAALKIDRSEAKFEDQVKVPVGCPKCRNLGYHGRIALFEMLRVDDYLHDHVVNRSSARLIRQVAIKHGMRTLQACGWAQVKRGATSLAEVMRYAESEDEDKA